MKLKKFNRQPAIKDLTNFSDYAFIAKCKDKSANNVWVVIDFNESIKDGN
jgi:hypothetical protein